MKTFLFVAALWCARFQDPGGEPVDTGFWAKHGDRVLVGVVTAVIVLFLSEPIKKLFGKLFEWLGRLLESLGWRFGKRYLEALAERHRWLRLIGMYGRADVAPPRLQEVYVSLRLAAGKGQERPRLHWHQVFAGEKGRVVILGPPGSGKSTLLSYLALVLAGAVPHRLRDSLHRPLPLFGRLREIGTEGGPTTLMELLQGSSGLSSVPKGFFERRLRRGGCVVLLDGLDEVLDEARHHRVVQGINGLVSEYPDNTFVVTCRVAGWSQQLPGYKTYEIQQLGDDGIHQFIAAWYREVLRTEAMNLLGPTPRPEDARRVEAEALTEAVERGEALWEALHSNEALFRIARTPLLLSLITLVHFHRVTDLPRGRAELYKQCLEILLDLWDRQDKRLRLEGPSLKEKLLVLRAIAFHFLEHDLLEARAEVVQELVEALLPQLKVAITARDLVDQIWKRSGILVEQAIGVFGFAHRALLDYLAADYIVEHGRDQLLLDHVAEERWREVILIAIGRVPAKRAQKLVRVLLDREGAGEADLEIACLSLGEDVQLGDELCGEVRQRLLSRLGTEQSAAGFGRLVTALMVADVERAQDWMREVLEGRDPGLRSRVLGLIPGLGERHAKAMVPLLLRIIGEADEKAQVRASCAAVLAGVDIKPDAEVWQVLGAARRETDLGLRRAATWAWCELGRFDGLGLVRIPAGEFMMGSDEYSYEKPPHRLFLPDFYMARSPATVAQYREFVEASGHEVEDRDALKGADDHPVAWVSWYDARAFAEYHGFSLPSEAEWEKAARGTDGREYPWGNEWRGGLANTEEYWQKWGLWRRILRLGRRGPGSTTAVGRFSPAGDSQCGCVDMAGNVWEWTRSLWGEDWQTAEFGYPYRADDGREDEEAPSPKKRVLRGGSFIDHRFSARCSYRCGLGPDFRLSYLGFRVAVPPFPLTSENSDL